MTFKYKILLLMVADLIGIIAASVLAIFLRFEMTLPSLYLARYFTLATLELPLRLVINSFFGLYDRLWRYASIRELVTIVSAVSVGTIFVGIAVHIPPFLGFPRSIVLLSWLLNVFFLGGIRFAVRLRQEFHARKVEVTVSESAGSKEERTRLLIVGAGEAGNMIAKEIARQPEEKYLLLGYVDDDLRKVGFRVNGIPILGTTRDIPAIAHKYAVEEVLIAIPSASGATVREIIRKCENLNLKFTTLPRIFDLVDGKVSVSHIRNVQIEDLLGRDEVKVDLEAISGYLTDSVVLVTGAGGSIGSELCRQVARFSPKRIVLLGHGENSIYHINMELCESYPGLDIVPVIADIQDEKRIAKVFAVHRPDVVFHAAAHKHVPLMEANPGEAVKNNVFGTKNVALAAHQAGAKRFVMISTDKAVNPTSIMGASKRAAEMVIQMIDKDSATKFVAVRFGNVLGSRGSVIPLFKKQIEKGGPVTVTHPDMKRYFMTIPEAVQLVIQAGAMGNGGEVFVLDMGEPVKILDMARDLIRLSGLKPDIDIKIEFCGTRPGEKLFEELLTAEEGTLATRHRRIFVARGTMPFAGGIDEFLSLMTQIADGNHPRYRDVREFVNDLVGTRVSRREEKEEQVLDQVAATVE